MKKLTILSLALMMVAACSNAPTPVNVAPPVVITVVVTPGGSAPANTGTQAATSQPAPKPAPTSAYPEPAHNTKLFAVYEAFEHGFMIYLDDRKVIWVFYQYIADANNAAVPTVNYGTWQQYPDTFVDGQPETDPSIIPPPSFQQPKRGFGKVWRDNSGVRGALGWALDFERGYTASVVDFSIGTFDDKGVFSTKTMYHTITTDKGDTFHVDESSGTWSKS